MKYLFSFFLLVGFFNSEILAQESLIPLHFNPQLKAKEKQATLKTGKVESTLPFFDDFSANSIFPNQQNWIDDHVFINNSFGIGPVSIGVATFDAVDSDGFVYSQVETQPKIADRLTSNQIDLSAYTPADSLYLTFYFQPQGLGDKPEYDDSLKLEFLTPDTTVLVWFANGTDFKSFKTNTLNLNLDVKDTIQFKMIHIKVVDPVFFNPNFQFRFSNYASTFSLEMNGSRRTNCDMWNIDYVYFDADRSMSDTIFADVAFVEQPKSFIKTYTSVPWAHFDEAIAKIRSDVYYNLRNNDKIERNLSAIILKIKDAAKDSNYFFRKGLDNELSGIDPFTNYFDIRYAWSDNFPIAWYEASKAIIEMEAELSVQNADPIENNKAYRTVIFDDYYAYDDGTAEYAYGITDGARKAAHLIETYKPDTLIGFSMYFVPNKEDYGALQTFFPSVWASSDAKPGALLYKEESGSSVELSDTRNEFVTVTFSEPVFVENTFFIGWEQNENLSINLGFDANNNTRPKRFYYYNGAWYEGDNDKEGSLMIRPIFAKSPITTITQIATNFADVIIFPNPSTGDLQISFLNGDEQGTMTVYNSIGTKVFESILNKTNYSLGHLPNGVYLVMVQTNNGSHRY